MLLTHAFALSASRFVHKKKSLRIYTSMHWGGLELTKNWPVAGTRITCYTTGTTGYVYVTINNIFKKYIIGISNSPRILAGGANTASGAGPVRPRPVQPGRFSKHRPKLDAACELPISRAIVPARPARCHVSITARLLGLAHEILRIQAQKSARFARLFFSY